MVCVNRGAVYTDLVNQLEYISGIISLLRRPNEVALLYARAVWHDCCAVARDLVLFLGKVSKSLPS
jgi:hypothetical protein